MITTNDPHALEGFHAHAEVIGLEQYMLQGYIKANNDLITEPSSFSVTLFPVFLRLLITMGLEFYSRSAVVVVIVVQSLNLAFFLCPP